MLLCFNVLPSTYRLKQDTLIHPDKLFLYMEWLIVG